MGSQALTPPGRSSPTVAVYTMRVEREKLRRFREIAAKEHRTASQKLRVMIEAEIEAHESVERVA